MGHACATCGKVHDEWPPQFGFTRPDGVWDMSATQRRERVLEGDDCCVIDGERSFARAVLNLPIAGSDLTWGLGLWVELGTADFGRYLDAYSRDATGEPPLAGTIANFIDVFPDAYGTKVAVELGIASERPRLRVLDTDSPLGRAQHAGMSESQLHEALAVLGYADDE